MITYNHYGVRSGAVTTARVGGTTAAQATARDRLMPCDLATWSPMHCLVSAFDTPRQARAAMAVLAAEGFLDTDILLVRPQAIMALDEACRARSLFTRILASIRTPGSESLTVDEYVDEARRGHYLLIVYAPREDQRRNATRIVAHHQAHTIHYFGRWTIRGIHQRQGTDS
jgi:hypothetical protein